MTPKVADKCEICEDGWYGFTRVGPGPIGEPAVRCSNCGHEVLLV